MLNKELNSLFNEALEFAKSSRHEYVTIEHVFFTMLTSEQVIKLLNKCGADTKFLLERIKTHLDSVFKPLPEDSYHDPFETVALARVIDSMITQMKDADKKQANVIDLLVALFVEERSYSVYLLKQQGVSELTIIESIKISESSTKINSEKKIIEKSNRIRTLDELNYKTRFIISDLEDDYDLKATGLLSKSLNKLLNNALDYAKKNRHEYVTVEHVFFSALKNFRIKKILHTCGADIPFLYKKVEEHLESAFKPLPEESHHDPFETVALAKMIDFMIKNINKINKKQATVLDLLVSFFEVERSYSVYLLKQQDITPSTLLSLKQNHSNLPNKTKLNEIKVVFIGDARVGKTSLIKKIFNEEIDNDEQPTIEIDISYYISANIVAHFWDFGGQVIMHNIHPFFLKENALYILVLDASKDQKPEYWLNYIKYFAGNAPVMIVNNKSEGEFTNNLEIRLLMKKYPNILHDDYKISCKNNIGLKKFKVDFNSALQDIYSKNMEISSSWIKIKNKIQNLKDRNIFNYSYFLDICTEMGVTNYEEQNTILNLLDTLGVVLNFGSSEKYDTLIFQPHWLTYAIYKIIINKQIEKNNGCISKREIQKILMKNPKNKFRYTNIDINFIIDLLLEFELAFYANNKRDIIFPLHLSKDEIKHPFKRKLTSINFQYEFEFFPPSIFTKLLTKLEKYIYTNFYWRHGVIIKHDGIIALVEENSDKKVLTIHIQKEKENKENIQREFLSIIRSKIKEILAEFNEANFQYNEVILYKGIKLDYQELLGYEEGGAYKKYIPKLREYINIQEILNGFVIVKERLVEYKYKNVVYNIIKNGDKVKNKIEFNDKTKAKNIIFAEHIQDSFNKIKNSDSKDTLKELLQELNTQALEVSKHLAKDESNAFIDDVEILTNESFLNSTH